MQYIGGRVINSPGLVSKAINWVTASLWDHFEFWIDAEMMVKIIVILKAHGMPCDYPAEGGYLGAHAGTGIEFRPLNYCVPSREKRYQWPCTDKQFEAWVVSAFGKIGTPYNYLDIGIIFFHLRKLTSDTREICSEFGFAECAKAAQVETEPHLVKLMWLLNVELDYAPLITPETLHLSPVLMGNCKYSYPS